MEYLQGPCFERDNLLFSVWTTNWFILGLGSTSDPIAFGWGKKQSYKSSWGGPYGAVDRMKHFFLEEWVICRTLNTLAALWSYIKFSWGSFYQFIDFKKWDHLVVWISLGSWTIIRKHCPKSSTSILRWVTETQRGQGICPHLHGCQWQCWD